MALSQNTNTKSVQFVLKAIKWSDLEWIKMPRSSRPEKFFGEGVQKIRNKFTGE